MTRLFHGVDRECSICGARARGGLRFKAKDEPCIVAINVYLSRRAELGSRVKASIRVLVCEECLVKALGQGRLGFLSGTHEANHLWGSVKERLISLYSALVDEDSRNPIRPKAEQQRSYELQGSLP